MILTEVNEKDLKQILSQARIMKTYATNLEANVVAFLGGVGAAKEKPKSKKLDQVARKVQSKFHKTLRVKE